MSYEPDTNDIQLRQLREQIAKIREEQFAKAFPTNQGGGATLVGGNIGNSPTATGVVQWIPSAIKITKDTGVIDKLDYKQQVTNKAFVIGEIITGMSSGAPAEIGDIDIIIVDDTGTLILVPNSITGSFTDNENLNGDINGDAKADGTLYTQTGRGHLNAGASSIIADAVNISTPFEIHFLDNAQQDGQLVYIRAQNGQTIKMRRAVTDDANTGNLDLDESFDIIENALVLFQFQEISNVTPQGGWVPLITDVSAGAGTGGTAFQFPILYPKENLGTTSGVIDLALNQSDGHYKQITLDGDASLTFSNLPPSVNGFKFYVLTIQDGTGGHVYTDLPDSVINESDLLGQLQTSAFAQTLWQFSTADGGTNWHASVINTKSSTGDNLGNHCAEKDLDMKTFDIVNIDKLIFFGAGGFSFPTDASIQGISTSGTGLQSNVATSQTYRYFIAGNETFQITSTNFFFFDNSLKDVGSIFFTTGGSFSSAIFPNVAFSELSYTVDGIGAHHSFFANNALNAVFEIREDVVKSNVNFDVVTNDIINIDQAQFDSAGGFEPLINHGERRITGGSQGISMNIPKISPFAGGFNIFFENDAQDNSDLIYRFEKNRLVMPNCATIEASLGYLLCNGGGLTDIATRVILNTGQNPSTFDPQPLEFQVSNTTKVEIDFASDEGFKMFTGINLNTFNMINIDQLLFIDSQGFNNATGHGERRITGGSEGINLNIPQGGTFPEFAIWFEQDDLVKSNTVYKFREDALIMGTGIDCLRSPLVTGAIGYQLCRGGGLFEGITRTILQASADSGTLPSKQILELNVAGSTKMTLSDVGADRIRVFETIGMERRSIRNLDQLIFASIPVGAGTPSSGQFGITVHPTDFQFLFNASTSRGFRFESGRIPIATLSRFQLRLLRTSGFFAPAIVTEGSFIVGEEHTQGDFGIVNGEHRLVNDGSGSLDVFFGTGDKVVNLSQLTGVGPGVSTSDLVFFQDEFVYVDDTVINSKYNATGTFNSVGGELYGVIEMDSGDTISTSAGRLTTENSFRIDPSLGGNSAFIITPIPESREQFHFYGYSSNDLNNVISDGDITADSMYGFLFDADLNDNWKAYTRLNGVSKTVDTGSGQNNTRQRLEANHDVDAGTITFKINGITVHVETTNIPDGEMFLIAYASNRVTGIPTQRSMFLDFWQATAERVNRP